MCSTISSGLKLLLASFIVFVGIKRTFAQHMAGNHGNESIIYIKLPSGISKADVVSGKQEIKTALHNHTKSILYNQTPDSISRLLDLIVVFTEQDGMPILPDKGNLENQLSRSAGLIPAELTFTFNSPGQPWSQSEQLMLNNFARDIYPVIKTVMGNPFFDITVNVRKDNSMETAGVYYPSLNEMVLKDLVDHVFCHETIHAFRDDFVIGLSTYEEGITRATEVEVFNQLANYTHPFDEFHTYTYDCYYEALNTPEIATFNGNVFSNVTHTLLRYQLGSYIWAKAYLEDNGFLKRFNDSLYTRMLNDPGTKSSEIKLRNIFAAIKPIVEGFPNAIWYERQFLLNSNPTNGYKLYQRVNQFTIDYFNRNSVNEIPEAGVPVSWRLLDHTNGLIVSGSDFTSQYGFIDFYHNFPGGYFGKVKVVASVQSPTGLINDTAFRIQQYPDQGIFGIVEDANSGTVTVTPLDTTMAPATSNLINGAFAFPQFQNVRGRFRYVFTYPDHSLVSRIFTKDRSMYYVFIKNDPKTYWNGSMNSSWHNPLNWSGGIVPVVGSEVVIPPNTINNCIISSPAVCKSLMVLTGANLVANGNLTILF